jgi:hypothetical protein
MISRNAIAIWLLSPWLATIAAAQDEPAPAVKSPEVGKELSQVEGVSIVRQPFKFFGQAGGSISGGSGEGDPLKMKIEGLGLKEAIEFFIGGSDLDHRTRLHSTAKFPSGRYNISVTAADQDAAFAAFAKAYEQSFGIKVVREKRELPALVLNETGDADAKPLVKAGADAFGGTITPRELTCASNLDGFASSLESWLGQIVVNDVAREGTYQFGLRVKTSRRKDLDAYLKEHGLVLVEEKRAVEAVFVEDAKATPEPAESPRGN